MSETAPGQTYVTSDRLHITICDGCGSAVFDTDVHDKFHATIAAHGTAITALKGAVTTVKKAVAARKPAKVAQALRVAKGPARAQAAAAVRSAKGPFC
jgi:hypothetical protein